MEELDAEKWSGAASSDRAGQRHSADRIWGAGARSSGFSRLLRL